MNHLLNLTPALVLLGMGVLCLIVHLVLRTKKEDK